jgi:hypothetical protein
MNSRFDTKDSAVGADRPRTSGGVAITLNKTDGLPPAPRGGLCGGTARSSASCMFQRRGSRELTSRGLASRPDALPAGQYEDVQLLPDADRPIVGLQWIEHLQHGRLDPLGVVSRERRFWSFT